MKARVILCEPEAEWVMAMRPYLREGGTPVVETRGARDAWRELEASPASVVFWSLALPGFRQVLEHIFAQHVGFPDSHAVVLANRGQSMWVWPTLEAGAIDAVVSPRALPRVMDWVVHHIQRHEPIANSPSEHPLVAPSWRLPWGGILDGNPGGP